MYIIGWFVEGYSNNDKDEMYNSSAVTSKERADGECGYKPISSSKPFFGFEKLTDERGYMRDGKAEELVYQLEKAKRLGRLTDDRGFIIDEDSVLTRRDHYDPDEDWKEDRDDDD